MIYRSFGRDKEKISQLGFGLMRLPVLDHDYGKIDEEKAIALIRYAIDHGVNYLDTAYPYHSKKMDKPGMSEPLLAKALKDGYREKVKIATKLPSWLIKSRKDMDKYLDYQLSSLETDCIDYYLLHSLNSDLWENLKTHGALSFLDSAKAEGRISHTGFSFHGDNLDLFQEMIDAYPWDMCLIQYNYLDSDYCPGMDGIRYAAAKGVDIVVMEPLRGGTLVNDLPAAAVKALQEADPHKTLAEWSFRWLWNHPEIKVVLSGMNTMEQLRENIAVAADAQADSMSKEDLTAIAKAKAVIEGRIKVGCTGCNYCMPCPEGIDIPKNFHFYNRISALTSEKAKSKEKEQYAMALTAASRADRCLACGKCETHCPQGIKIRDELKNVVQAMKKGK